MVKPSRTSPSLKHSSSQAGQANSPRNNNNNNNSINNSSNRGGPAVQPSSRSVTSATARAANQASNVDRPELSHRYRRPSATPSESETEVDSDGSSTCVASHPSSRSSTCSPDPEYHHESRLARQKRLIVDKCMALFEKQLEKDLQRRFGTSYGNNQGESSGSDGLGNTGKSDSSGRGGRDKPDGGQKRQLSDNEGDSADTNGDGGGKDGSNKKRTKRSEEPRRKLACPFYKNDPDKYRHERTCCGPGWEDAHRMKEHLYRSHSLTYLCHRCQTNFRKESRLKAHHRASTPCELNTDDTPDGMDPKTEAKLRSKSASKGSSDEQKWEETYRILFPNQPVPSPYYDDDEDDTGSGKTNPDAQLVRYMWREAPKKARVLLEKEFNQEMDILNEKMMRRLTEVYKLTIHELFEAYSQGRRSLSRSPESEDNNSIQAAGPSSPKPPMPPPPSKLFDNIDFNDSLTNLDEEFDFGEYLQDPPFIFTTNDYV